MAFFDTLFHKKTSADNAKGRMINVLICDRAGLSPQVLERIHDEILDVIKKHMTLEHDEIEVKLKPSNDVIKIAMTASLKTLRQQDRQTDELMSNCNSMPGEDESALERFFSKWFHRKTSGEKAKQRMLSILIYDQSELSPEVLQSVKTGIANVIKTYVTLSSDDIAIELIRDKNGVVLEVNADVKALKRPTHYGLGPEKTEPSQTAFCTF